MGLNTASAKHGLVYGVLFTLAILTVAARLVLSGPTGNITIFAIAFLMAGLVAVQYMGLKWEGRLIYLVIAIPMVLFIILVVVLIPDVTHFPFHLRF